MDPIKRLESAMNAETPDPQALALSFVNCAANVAVQNGAGGLIEEGVVSAVEAKPQLVQEAFRQWVATNGLVVTQAGQVVNF